MINTSDFQPEGQWFEPGLCHCVVSLDEKHPIQGGVEILLVASCYENQVKLQKPG